MRLKTGASAADAVRPLSWLQYVWLLSAKSPMFDRHTAVSELSFGGALPNVTLTFEIFRFQDKSVSMVNFHPLTGQQHTYVLVWSMIKMLCLRSVVPATLSFRAIAAPFEVYLLLFVGAPRRPTCQDQYLLTTAPFGLTRGDTRHNSTSVWVPYARVGAKILRWRAFSRTELKLFAAWNLNNRQVNNIGDWFPTRCIRVQHGSSFRAQVCKEPLVHYFQDSERKSEQNLKTGLTRHSQLFVVDKCLKHCMSDKFQQN